MFEDRYPVPEFIAARDIDATCRRVRVPVRLERRTTPQEIAAVIVSLLSFRTAHIRGQHFFVDGDRAFGRLLT
jgi:hypothetical protein